MAFEQRFFKKGVEARLRKEGRSLDDLPPKKEIISRRNVTLERKKAALIQKAQAEIEAGSPLLEHVPEGALTNVERIIFILAVERLNSPWFIIKVLKIMNISIDEPNISEEFRSKPKFIYDIACEAMDKIAECIHRDQTDMSMLWMTKKVNFLKSENWSKYIY